MPAPTLRARISEYMGSAPPPHPGLEALLSESTDGDEREVAVIVVGVGAEPGLERMIDFLGSRFDVPIRAVTFDVFETVDGDRVLVREDTEPESAAPSSGGTYSADKVIAAAGGARSAMGIRMLAFVAAAERNGLYPRPYRWSFMFTRPRSATGT